MTLIYGLTDKNKEKIKTLFENVGIYTSNDNKVNITLKGIGKFDILPEEHNSSPSYISGLPYAYQYFKGEGKELNFEDLINMEDNLYAPEIARRGLTKIILNKKLDVIYKGLKNEAYENNADLETGLLYESAKAFGNKSSTELEEIYKKLENSFIDRGFMDMFNNLFGKQFLENNETLKLKFQKSLFNAIRDKSFITSVGYSKIDLSSGFRGNEYIGLLRKLDKYKTN